MSARPIRSSKTLLLLAASGLALAGCKIDNRPLLARGGPPPVAELPQPGPIEPVAGGPYYAPAAQAIPARAYPYAERAYALDRTFYDVPPDYGFYYGDEEPWVWQTADDSLMFAEPYDAGYRYYYYEPGDAYPYFVRDADYGYALGPDGALIALFTAAGALLAADQYDQYYPEARQYWTRGYDMYQDYGRAPRRPVDMGAWSQRAPVIARSQQAWINAPAAQPRWREWRSSEAGRAVVQRVDAVRPARTAEAPGGGFRGRYAAPAQTMAAVPPGRGMRFGPHEARRFAAPPAMARNDAGRFAPRPAAPSVQEHGRWATARAPALQPAPPAGPRSAPMRRAEARPPHGPPAMRAAAPPQDVARQPHGREAHLAAAQPHPGFQPHGGRGQGGGPAHFAQAAPPQVQPHGGGHGGPPHPQAAPVPRAQAPQQPHPGGGSPHGQGGQGGGQGGGHGGAHGGDQGHGGGDHGRKHGG